jgi:hypothetical protein
MYASRKLTGVVRFLYTQNPFYVISACLILYGLYAAFRSGDAAVEHPWWIALALCGYTAVMAVTALLIIKLGKVWDDARSIVLILLLQFAAVSMSFDQLCSTAPGTASGLLAFGFGFAVLVTEGLLRGLRIRLAVLYRVPYYLLLGLLFAGPLWVAPRTAPGTVGLMAWRLYLFPVVAGLVLLTLLPAARRGASYTAGNGTPWRWPWFPWTAFLFLGFAAGVRSYVLTYNFNMLGAGDAFGAYYLAPLLLAALIVALELSITAHRRWLQAVLLAVAPLLVVLSVPGNDNHIYRLFLRTFMDTVGSPIWVAVVGLAGFYGYAWQRRLPGAEAGLTTMLLLLTVVGRQTVDVETLAPPAWWPWTVLAAVQGLMALRRRRSPRWGLASACGVLASVLAWRDTWFLEWYGAFPAHALLVAWLLIGWVFRDRFALLLRRTALLLTVAGMSLALAGLGHEFEPRGLLAGYAATLAAVVWAYGWATGDRWCWAIGTLQLAGLGLVGVTVTREPLVARVGSDALRPLCWGVASFLLALLISTLKGGLGRHLQARATAWRIARVPPDLSRIEGPEVAPSTGP